MFDSLPSETVAELQAREILRVEDGNHGNDRPRPEEFGSGNTAFIRAADLDGGRVLFESADKISDVALARIRKGKGKPGDILFSSKGTVGKLAIVPMEAPPFVCSPQTTFWRTLDENQLDRSFLYAYMQSSWFRKQWQAIKGDTDMADYASLTSQRRFRVPLPEIKFQRDVASIFQPLNDKIELNRRLNRTLEELATTLFRSWFVDFDPVVDKAAERKPTHLRPELSSLFPAHFQDSDLGPIPHGWKVQPIGDVVKVVGGSTPSTNEPKFWDGDSAWATPRDLAALTEPVLTSTQRQITREGLNQISSGLLPKGTVLLSSRAPIGYTAIADLPVAINQGFIALICEGPLPSFYVIQWLRENMDTIEGRANGTTFMEISKKNFRPIAAVVPPPPVIEKFSEIVSTWWNQIIHNVHETQTLAALRDTLLPKLLSGELRVKQAERLVAAAN